MSKFDKICQAYAVAVKEYDDYENESRLFLNQLAGKMVAYMGIPQKHLQIAPADETKEYPSVIELEEDLFWHSSLILTIYRQADRFPHTPIKIKLRFKKTTTNTFVIYYADVETKFIINTQQDESYNQFYEAVFDNMVDNFKNNLGTILSSMASKKIGFTL